MGHTAVFSDLPRKSAKIRARETSPLEKARRLGVAPSPQAHCGGSMRHTSANLRQVSHGANERLLDFLQREHPAKTAEAVSAQLAAAGVAVSRAAIAKWFERSSAPSFSAYCGLIAAYGPRLLACVLGPGFAWLDEASASESRRQFDGKVERLKRQFGL